jgi:hypothetical protein
MNIASILKKIAETETTDFDAVSHRRQLLANWGPKLALTALPLGLSAIINPAKAHSSDEIAGLLNYLLKIEMLLSGFYEQGMSTPGLVSDDNMIALTQITTNSAAHQKFIRSLVQSRGGIPINEPNFDYSGGNGLGTGPYADVFIVYSRFLGMAQMFEELAIRAYQGVLPHMMEDQEATMNCSQVHTVKSRHAAMLRKIRRDKHFSTAKSWITQNQSGIPVNFTQAVWNGEENTLQSGIPVQNLGVNADAATEAFDEPLSQSDVETILDPFIG